jgi:hypothetical protein
VELQLAALADAANISTEGKLNILGTFDIIYAAAVPVVWPCIVFVAKVELSTADGEQLHFQIRVLSEDGDLQFQATLEAQLQRDSIPVGEMPGLPILLPVNNAKFDAYGTYTVELWGNGKRLIGLPLHIRHPPSQPGQG